MQPKLELFTHSSPLAMRWRDHDEYGHVNNSVYLTYLEEARIRYFRDAYKWDWQKDGLILARTEIDFVRPLKFYEPAAIHTRIASLGTKSFGMEYQIVKGSGEQTVLMTAATSRMVMFNYKENKPFPVPERIREMILAYEKEGSVQQ